MPYPLVGVISPWNGPLMLSCLDPVPALFAGCAVIVKPSEVAPRFVEPLMDTIRAGPELAAVFTFVTGDGVTGQQLIQQVDILCFTGSVANGRKVAVACAQRLIPAYLELGGKDPAIVTATADLDAAATAVLRGAAFGTGQVCFSVERVYVHEDVHDASAPPAPLVRPGSPPRLAAAGLTRRGRLAMAGPGSPGPALTGPVLALWTRGPGFFWPVGPGGQARSGPMFPWDISTGPRGPRLRTRNAVPRRKEPA